MRLAWLFIIAIILSSCTTVQEATDTSAPETDIDPDIDNPRVNDDQPAIDDDRCVDPSYAASMQCAIDQEVTTKGCENGQVHCGYVCHDAKVGASVCKEGTKPATANCPAGMFRCVLPEGCKSAATPGLTCAEGEELTDEGCPFGYLKCAKY